MSGLERNEMRSLSSSLHFMLPRALQITHPMDLFAIYLSEILEGQNYELHRGCTSNSLLCPENTPGLLRSTFTPPLPSRN